MINLEKIKKKLIAARIKDIKDKLKEIVKEEAIDPWMEKPNKAFDGFTPLQLIELGEQHRIYAMISDIGGGQLS